MKSEIDLKHFYDSTLSGLLKDLEGKRRKIASKLIILWVVLGSVFLLGSLILAVAVNPVIAIPLFIFLLIVGLIVHFFLFGREIKSFTSEFKVKIVVEVVRFVDENLSYAPDNGICQQVYLDSQIFLTHPDRYKCEDYVSGKIGETQVEFSEIHSEYKTESTDSKGNHHTEWHTIFRGLFFIADFNKDFHGTTVVLPDLAEKAFGFIGKIFQSWNLSRKGQLIKLEDPEFEKLFVVYGDDQITARYILTPGLMQRLVEFRENVNNTIFLSFKESKVYMAITVSRNLFEPRIFSSNEDFALIRDYFANLELASKIIEELGLNTRIWK